EAAGSPSVHLSAETQLPALRAAAHAPRADPPASRRLQGSRGAASFHHFVRACEDRLRHCEAERLRGLEIENELVFGRLLDGQITGLLALENAVYVERGPREQIRNINTVGKQTATLHIRTIGRDHWQLVLDRE